MSSWCPTSIALVITRFNLQLSPKCIIMKSHRLRDTSSWDLAGSEFHSGMVQGKKLSFIVSVEVDYLSQILDRVCSSSSWGWGQGRGGVVKLATGISTRPCMILNITVTCDSLLYVWSVSQLMSSSMSITLPMFRYVWCILLPASGPSLSFSLPGYSVRAPYIWSVV